MPSLTRTRDDSPSHLSNILGVAPDSEKNCVGYARTKGRRCSLPGSDIRGRAQASRLLDEGTRLLESGEENIDEILQEVAPLLLCRRWHQTQQAGQLVYEWSKKVEKFNERRRASAGFLLRSPSPAPVREAERNRQYRATQPEQSTGRASRAYIDETASIERANNSRAIRISSAPPHFDTFEQLDMSSNTIPASVATMNRPRRHTPRTPSVPTMLWTPSANNLQDIYRQLTEESYIFELEYSGLYTYPSSAVGTSHVSHGSSRRYISDQPRATRSESSNRMPSPQTAIRSSRAITSEYPRQQTTTTSSSRSTQARSEAEARTSISRSPSRPARNPARRQASRSEVVTRRHVEGECSICYLPLQDEDALDTENGYESGDSDDSSEEEEEEEGYEELVWCRRRCGNNFHKDCMESWIDTFENSEREPTCPMCRAGWVVEQ